MRMLPSRTQWIVFLDAVQVLFRNLLPDGYRILEIVLTCLQAPLGGTSDVTSRCSAEWLFRSASPCVGSGASRTRVRGVTVGGRSGQSRVSIDTSARRPRSQRGNRGRKRFRQACGQGLS